MPDLTARWFFAALAICTIGVATVSFAAGTNRHTAAKTLTRGNITAVQGQEDARLKYADKHYRTQAKANSRHYKKLAQQVAKSGGDPQPLLDAAAYFDSQAER